MANDPAKTTPPPPIAGDPLTALQRYEAAIAGLRAGLLDLEASPSYLMLSGDEVGPVTAAKVGNAAGGTDELWAELQAADAALQHIRRIVDDKGLRGANRQEVVDLLVQRWVVVGDPDPTQAPTPHPPAGSGRPPARSVGELVEGVRRRYDALRPHVAEIDQLWLSILPRLDAARGTLDRLDTEVQTLGIPEPLIGRARALVTDLEERLVGDPLSVVTGDGDQLDSLVAQAAKQVATLLASRDALDDDAAQTEELLASLRVLRARAEAAGREAGLKVVGGGPAEAAEVVRVPSEQILDGPGGLAEQLDELLALGPDATWSQRRGVLDAWLAVARRLEDQLTQALEANCQPLARRDELRGRLRAYQAKIAAVGRAEDLDLAALVDGARSQLYTAPADLTRAASTIDELARRLLS